MHKKSSFFVIKFPSWNRCGGRPVGLAKLGFGVWGLGFRVWGLAKKKVRSVKLGFGVWIRVWGCGLGFSLLFLVTSVLGYFIGFVVGTHNSK